MIRIAALNAESSYDEDRSCSVAAQGAATKEAQEAEAFQVYSSGLAHQQAGELQEAEDVFNDLLETPFVSQAAPRDDDDEDTPLQPNQQLRYSIHKNLANIATQRGQDNEAMEQYLQAVVIDCSDVSVWYRVGRLAIKLVHFQLARHAFEQGLLCNPRHWPCLDNVIPVLYALNNYEVCLEYIAQALERDPGYIKALAFMQQIFKEQPSLRKDNIQRFKQCDPSIYSIELEPSEKEEPIEEALMWRGQKRERCKPPEKPVVKLTQAITTKTWECLGQCLVALYNYIDSAPGPINLCCKVDLQSEPEIQTGQKALAPANVSMETEPEPAEPPPEEPSEPVSSNQLPPEESKSAVTIEEEDEPTRSSNKRRRSVFDDPTGKRRSARVKNVATTHSQREKNVDYLESLRHLMPDRLCHVQADEELAVNQEEPEGNAEAIKEPPPVVVATEENSAGAVERLEADGQDVATFIGRCARNNGIIDILNRYLLHVLRSETVKWNQSLITVFMQAYSRFRNHIEYPDFLGKDAPDSRIKSMAQLCLFHGELQLDKWACAKNKAASPKKGSSLQVITTEADLSCPWFEDDLFYLLGVASCKDILGEHWNNFSIRAYWLRSRYLMLQGQMEMATDSFQRTRAYLCVLGEEDKVNIILPHCVMENSISANSLAEQLEQLQRCQSFEAVQRLSCKGDHDAVVELLIQNYHRTTQKTKYLDSDDEERQGQLLLLVESLLTIKDYKRCLFWGETCFNEALQRYQNVETDKAIDAWQVTMLQLLHAINRCLEEQPGIIASLPSQPLVRLTQNLHKLIELATEGADGETEMAINTVLPWILLYKLVSATESKDGSSQSKKASSDDESDDDDDEWMPQSLRLLNLAHDCLGRHSWCMALDGQLLYFIIDAVTGTLNNESLDDILFYKEELEQMLEQCFYCLYYYPNKRKLRHIADHNVPQVTFTWERAAPLFDYFKPKPIPEFDSVKANSVTAEQEALLRKMTNLIPDNMPILNVDTILAYIEGGSKEVPEITLDKKEEIQKIPVLGEINYLLADYYFKNKEQTKAIKYYLQDLCVFPDRFDSWAGMALARSSRLENKLNTHELKMDGRTEGPVWKQGMSALRCYKRALELKDSNCTLWIEYGALAYQLHSYASRSLKHQQRYDLNAEQVSEAKNQREEMLHIAERCYQRAIETHEEDDDEEEWLCHYMLGKVAEKLHRHPKQYLEQYTKAAYYLHEDQAKYPKKITYVISPPHLAVEALEVFYRLHVSVFKLLLKDPYNVPYETILHFMRAAAESPFNTGKERKSSEVDYATKMLASSAGIKTKESIPDHDYFRQMSGEGPARTETDNSNDATAGKLRKVVTNQRTLVSVTASLSDSADSLPYSPTRAHTAAGFPSGGTTTSHSSTGAASVTSAVPTDKQPGEKVVETPSIVASSPITVQAACTTTCDGKIAEAEKETKADVCIMNVGDDVGSADSTQTTDSVEKLLTHMVDSVAGQSEQKEDSVNIQDTNAKTQHKSTAAIATESDSVVTGKDGNEANLAISTTSSESHLGDQESVSICAGPSSSEPNQVIVHSEGKGAIESSHVRQVINSTEGGSQTTGQMQSRPASEAGSEAVAMETDEACSSAADVGVAPDVDQPSSMKVNGRGEGSVEAAGKKERRVASSNMEKSAVHKDGQGEESVAHETVAMDTISTVTSGTETGPSRAQVGVASSSEEPAPTDNVIAQLMELSEAVASVSTKPEPTTSFNDVDFGISGSSQDSEQKMEPDSGGLADGNLQDNASADLEFLKSELQALNESTMQSNASETETWAQEVASLNPLEEEAVPLKQQPVSTGLVSSSGSQNQDDESQTKSKLGSVKEEVTSTSTDDAVHPAVKTSTEVKRESDISAPVPSTSSTGTSSSVSCPAASSLPSSGISSGGGGAGLTSDPVVVSSEDDMPVKKEDQDTVSSSKQVEQRPKASQNVASDKLEQQLVAGSEKVADDKLEQPPAGSEKVADDKVEQQPAAGSDKVADDKLEQQPPAGSDKVADDKEQREGTSDKSAEAAKGGEKSEKDVPTSSKVTRVVETYGMMEVVDMDPPSEQYVDALNLCLQAFRTCAQRFPQHYKSLYRMACVYHYCRIYKNARYTRDLLLGNSIWQTQKHMVTPGLFQERKANNFFQGLWKIPIPEIDRAGTFACHLERSLHLLFAALLELEDNTTLLQIHHQLARTPDAGKKYLRDVDRVEISKRALSLCVDCVEKRLPKMTKEMVTVQAKFICEVQKVWQACKIMKISQLTKRAEELFVKSYVLCISAKVPTTTSVLEQAIQFCHVQQGPPRTPTTPSMSLEPWHRPGPLATSSPGASRSWSDALSKDKTSEERHSVSTSQFTPKSSEGTPERKKQGRPPGSKNLPKMGSPPAGSSSAGKGVKRPASDTGSSQAKASKLSGAEKSKATLTSLYTHQAEAMYGQLLSGLSKAQDSKTIMYLLNLASSLGLMSGAPAAQLAQQQMLASVMVNPNANQQTVAAVAALISTATQGSFAADSKIKLPMKGTAASPGGKVGTTSKLSSTMQAASSSSGLKAGTIAKPALGGQSVSSSSTVKPGTTGKLNSGGQSASSSKGVTGSTATPSSHPAVSVTKSGFSLSLTDKSMVQKLTSNLKSSLQKMQQKKDSPSAVTSTPSTAPEKNYSGVILKSKPQGLKRSAATGSLSQPSEKARVLASQAQMVQKTAAQSSQAQMAQKTAAQSSQAQMVQKTAAQSSQAQMAQKTAAQSSQAQMAQKTAAQSSQAQMVQKTAAQSSQAQMALKTAAQSSQAQMVQKTAAQSTQSAPKHPNVIGTKLTAPKLSNVISPQQATPKHTNIVRVGSSVNSKKPDTSKPSKPSSSSVLVGSSGRGSMARPEASTASVLQNMVASSKQAASLGNIVHKLVTAKASASNTASRPAATSQATRYPAGSSLAAGRQAAVSQSTPLEEYTVTATPVNLVAIGTQPQRAALPSLRMPAPVPRPAGGQRTPSGGRPAGQSVTSTHKSPDCIVLSDSDD